MKGNKRHSSYQHGDAHQTHTNVLFPSQPPEGATRFLVVALKRAPPSWTFDIIKLWRHPHWRRLFFFLFSSIIKERLTENIFSTVWCMRATYTYTATKKKCIKLNKANRDASDDEQSTSFLNSYNISFGSSLQYNITLHTSIPFIPWNSFRRLFAVGVWTEKRRACQLCKMPSLDISK